MRKFASAIGVEAKLLLESDTDPDNDLPFDRLVQSASAFGLDGFFVLLNTSLENIDTQSNSDKNKLVAKLIGKLVTLPGFASVFSNVLAKIKDFKALANGLVNLPLKQKDSVALALGLLTMNSSTLQDAGHVILTRELRDTETSSKNIPQGFFEELVRGWRSFGWMSGSHAKKVLESLPNESRNFLLSILSAFPVHSHGEPSEDNFAEMASQLRDRLHLDLFMEEKGPQCSANVKTCLETLIQFPNLTEHEICRLICTVSRNAILDSSTLPKDSVPTQWVVDVVLESLKKGVPRVNWNAVVESLDNDALYVPDQNSFTALIRMISTLSSDTFPIPAICGKVFANAQGQISFLRFAVCAHPDIFTFAHSPRTQPPIEGLHGHKSPIGTTNRAWLSLDLLEILCKLVESGYQEPIFEILDFPIKHCPEVLVIGLAKIQTEYKYLQTEVLGRLLPTYVFNNPNSGTVLHAVWSSNKEAVMSAMAIVLSKEPGQLGRILDICQEMKVLSTVLDKTPFGFSIELATLAARREYLNLEKWLSDMVTSHKDDFFQACLQFLNEKAINPQSSESPTSGIFLSNEAVATMFQILYSLRSKVANSDLVEKLKTLWSVGISLNPELVRVAVNELESWVTFVDVEEDVNDFIGNFLHGKISKEEFLETVKGYRKSKSDRDWKIFYYLIYNLYLEQKYLGVYEKDDMLQKTATIFGALIQPGILPRITRTFWLKAVIDNVHEIEDTKRFRFGLIALENIKLSVLAEVPLERLESILNIQRAQVEAPELLKKVQAICHELALTAEKAALTSPTAGGSGTPVSLPEIREDSVLRDLPGPSAPPGLPSIIGGVIPAVTPPSGEEEAPQPKLEDSMKGLKLNTKKSSEEIAKIEAVKVQPGPSNMEAVPEEAEASPVSPTQLQGQLKPLKVRQGTQPAFNSIFGQNASSKILENSAEERVKVKPPQEVVDKVFFVINNVTKSNLEQKSKELIAALKEEHFHWFAEYLIVRRVATEPNYHVSYMSLLESIKNKKLMQEVQKATYASCKVLLNFFLNKKTGGVLDNAEERSQLKNLGTWLGRITIGRNQPLLAKDIDLKELIIRSYDNSIMTAIVPFSIRVLDACVDNVVYKPPNPWTTSMLGLIREVFLLEGIKMGIVYEFEVLVPRYGLKMEDIQPTRLLEGRPRQIEGNPDFLEAVHKEYHPHVYDPSCLEEPKPNIGNIGVLGEQLYRMAFSSIERSIFSYWNFGPFIEFYNLQRFAFEVLENLTKMVINYTLPRFAAVRAMVKALVLKDFIMESDESVIFKSASDMAYSLAVPFIRVSLHEWMRRHSENAVISQFQAIQIPVALQATEVRKYILQFLDNNKEQIVDFAEKAIHQYFKPGLQDFIGTLIEYRRKLRHEFPGGVDHYDNYVFNRSELKRIPERLRPQPKKLSDLQQAVYDAFPNLEEAAQSHQMIQQAPPSPPQTGAIKKGVPQVLLNLDSQDEPSPAAAAILDRFTQLMQRAEMIIPRVAQSYANLPFDHPLRQIVKEIINLVPKTVNKEQILIPIARKVFLKMYDNITGLHFQFLIDILEKLRGLSRKVIEELTNWLCLADSEGHFNMDVTVGLIRFALVDVSDYTLKLSRLFSNDRIGRFSIDHAQHLEHYCVSQERLVSAAEFYHVKDALLKVQRQGGRSVWREKLLYEDEPVVEENVFGPAMETQIRRILGSFSAFEKKDPDIILQQCKPFLASEETVKGFFGTFLRIVIEQDRTTNPMGNPQSMVWLDTFINIVGFLVKLSQDRVFFKVGLFQRIMDCYTENLIKSAKEQKTNFNPKPYFRIFLGWYKEFLDGDFASFQNEFLECFVNGLLVIQPLKVPSFCFSWFELVTYRKFLPKLLQANERSPIIRRWELLLNLLKAHLKFLQPFLGNEITPEPILVLFRATVRCLLAIHGDNPEFFYVYFMDLCNCIPWTCIQMRSIVLGANPKGFLMPPITGDLQVDQQKEFHMPPYKSFCDFDTPLKECGLLDDLKKYLENRSPPTFLGENLLRRLVLSPQEAADTGTKYNVPAINCLVYHAGQYAVHTSPTNPGPDDGSAMDIYVYLLGEFDTEGRYMLLNSIINLMRYANRETQYYICVGLHIFSDFPNAKLKEVIQEQITRILVERLYAYSPYQWGVMLFFMELFRNPKYNFANLSFVRCHPEIHKVIMDIPRKIEAMFEK